MDRPAVDHLIAEYIEALDTALRTAQHVLTRQEYYEHLAVARLMLSRWRGGESEGDLKGAIHVELARYRNSDLFGREAEIVGRSFGSVCRALDIG